MAQSSYLDGAAIRSPVYFDSANVRGSIQSYGLAGGAIQTSGYQYYNIPREQIQYVQVPVSKIDYINLSKESFDWKLAIKQKEELIKLLQNKLLFLENTNQQHIKANFEQESERAEKAKRGGKKPFPRIAFPMMEVTAKTQKKLKSRLKVR